MKCEQKQQNETVKSETKTTDLVLGKTKEKEERKKRKTFQERKKTGQQDVSTEEQALNMIKFALFFTIYQLLL